MRTGSIASRPGARRTRSAALLLAAGLLVFATGCVQRPAIVTDALLEPLGRNQVWLPTPADQAAAELAAAALVARSNDGQPAAEVTAALARLEARADPTATGSLLPLAQDLRNATLDDPMADREAARALAKTRGLDPRLESRLDRQIADDPLRLAGRRQRDGWHRLWARTFNSVVEPIGSSAITGFVLAPFTLANSLVHYLAEFSNSEPLSVTDRQALAHRQFFVARHPDARITAEVEERIARDLPKLDATLAQRRLRASERALERGANLLALHHAEGAARLLEDRAEANDRLRRRATRAADRASEALDARGTLRSAALEAKPTPDAMREAEHALAGALLAKTLDPEQLAEAGVAYRDAAAATGDPALTEYVDARLDFVGAIAQHEAGRESRARGQLGRAANRDAQSDTMVRHAQALLDDAWQNPHGAFERLVRKANRDEFAWRVAGEWVRRPRYPNLPAPLAYLIDTPTIATTLILAPVRATISPFTGGTPDFRRGAALAGYRYLVRYPDGADQRAVIDWLFDYERSQGRFDRALRLADWIPDFDPEERAELVEKTAEGRLDIVAQLDRRDARASILRGVAQEFPDSDGGRRAGLEVRALQADASAQHIRITRDFLRENPNVAGREGAGLNPLLLNTDPRDGELHPEGIVLRGGRYLELRLLAEGGDDDAPPETRVLEISSERLRRLVTQLDDASLQNALADRDAAQPLDARRDTYLERARLGLAEDADGRATAESSFVYQSLRERYGAVRGRDSVLPFDLVFRGNLGDFTLGAFPRWRPPRETPDAFLYR